MARFLLIDETTRARIKSALEAARANPIPWLELRRHVNPGIQDSSVLTLENRGTVPPDRKPHIVEIEQGYRVNVSFEEQPAGIVKHVSVSVDTPGKLPNPPAMAMLLEEFGFKGGTAQQTWLEEFAPGHYAVNAVEFVEERQGPETRQ